MNYIKTILGTVVMTLLACGRGPEMIEEDQLKRIITEAMITSAMVDIDGKSIDTLDVYGEILKKEGVTLEDVKYTIQEMASRKSNPLNNLFENIQSDVDSITAKAAFRYKRKMKFDTLAMNFSRDTIYVNDTIINGSPDKFKAKIIDIKAGEYVIEFDYKSNKSYDIGVPMLKMFLCRKTWKNDRSVWVSRANQEQKFTQKVVVLPSEIFDTLVVGFSEPSKRKGSKEIDSSYVKNIRVLYNPPIAKSRKMYFDHIIKFKTDFSNEPILDSVIDGADRWKIGKKLRFDLLEWSPRRDSTKRESN